MGEKAKGIREIKKQYKDRPKDYDAFAKKVVQRYVYSQSEFSQHQVADELNISISAVRTLMDHAIVHAIVSRNVAEIVEKKAIYNQKQKHKEAGGSSISHHNDLIKQREDFIANNYEPIEIAFMVGNITYGGFSVEDTAKTFNIESVRILKLVLQRAIAENIATDQEAEILIERSLKKHQTESAKKYFEDLLKKRKEFIEANANPNT